MISSVSEVHNCLVMLFISWVKNWNNRIGISVSAVPPEYVYGFVSIQPLSQILLTRNSGGQ